MVGDVRATVSALETARRHCGSLADSLGAYHCGEGGEGGGECVRRVRPLVDELVELEQLQSYLGWLRCLHDFRWVEDTPERLIDYMCSVYLLNT